MASIMKRGDSYSVRYKYKDHSGKPCEGWESFKTRKEAQERKITVEKELLDGTFLVPDTMTVEEMLYKWIPIQSTKHKWSPKTYTQSVAMVQNLIVPYIGKRKVQELRTYDIEKFYATLAKIPCGQRPEVHPAAAHQEVLPAAVPPVHRRSLLWGLACREAIPVLPLQHREKAKVPRPAVPVRHRPLTEIIRCVWKDRVPPSAETAQSF